MFNVLHNANNIIGRKWAFYRYKSGFNLFDKRLKILFTTLQTYNFIYRKRSLVNCVHTLSLVRINHVSVEEFHIDNFNFIIDYRIILQQDEFHFSIL